MQILYRGVKPSEVEYVGTCNIVNGGCATKVKFKRSEAKEVPGSPANHGKGYLEITCPVCDSAIKSYFEKYVVSSPYYDNR